mmetsp:Transcript_5218/g.13246  ORF Transcript_5218/g.13246 Transcript_5218/m.13246 type:complete len:337 (-) Transcript_5218:621-1631(-)
MGLSPPSRVPSSWSMDSSSSICRAARATTRASSSASARETRRASRKAFTRPWLPSGGDVLDPVEVQEAVRRWWPPSAVSMAAPPASAAGVDSVASERAPASSAATPAGRHPVCWSGGGLRGSAAALRSAAAPAAWVPAVLAASASLPCVSRSPSVPAWALPLWPPFPRLRRCRLAFPSGAASGSPLCRSWVPGSSAAPACTSAGGTPPGGPPPRGGPPSAPRSSSEPFAPSLTSTVSMPLENSSPAAAPICASVSVGIPVMRASSVSLGLTTVRRARSSGLISPSCPPTSNTTGTPAAWAILATSMLTASGISRCSSSIPAPAMAVFAISVRAHPA